MSLSQTALRRPNSGLTAENGPRQVADMVNISSVAGRAALTGNGVYSLTKHGIGAFSASLRQEVAKRYVRHSLVEPGATATELSSHNRPEVLESIRTQFGQMMEAQDIAHAITYIVTRPRHVAVNEMPIRPPSRTIAQHSQDVPHVRSACLSRLREVPRDRSAAPMWPTGVKRACGFDPVTCVVSPGGPDCFFPVRAVQPELPAKNLLGLPWRLTWMLQQDGWILRNAVVWHKPNAMPESVRDLCRPNTRLSG